VEHPPRKVNQAHLERLRKICMAYPLDSGHDPEGEAPFGAGLEALTFFRRRRRGER
jgi:hypothetical protein